MGKIIIDYEKHYESFFGRYWGLILFPLLPFWLLARDDGMAGYLDIDSTSFKLKYKNKMHPQVIELSEGVHQIIYRKKSKFAIAFNLWTRSSGGALDNILDSMGAYDDYKLDGFELNFGPDTVVKLRAEGGVLRKCKIEDIENALPIPQEEEYGDPPKAKKLKLGCLTPILIAIALMALGFYASKNSGKMLGMINGGNSGGGTNQTQTDAFGENTDQTQENNLNKKMYVKADGGLKLREGPSMEHKFLYLLPERAEIVVLKIENGWAFAKYEGHQGWCSMDYLVEDSAQLDVPKEELPETSTGEKIYTVEEIEKGRDLANELARSYFGRVPNGGRTDITVDNVASFFEEAQKYYNIWLTDFGSQFENIATQVKVDSDRYPFLFFAEEQTAEDVCDRYFSLFSNDLAASYLNEKIFVLDGKLAVFSAGMGFEGRYISHSCEVQKISDTQIDVIVTIKEYEVYPYTSMDGAPDPDAKIVERTMVFPCVVEDGAWVFKDMETIYS